MKALRARRAAVAAWTLLTVTASVSAQSVGPDVIVGNIPDRLNIGTVGAKTAWAIGTTSCNIGNAVLSWVASTPAHPVIAQNLYRIKDNRFEQLGMSWLKHGFTALQGTVCGPCTPNPGGGSGLGIGCSDPYSASLNSGPGLGPRSEVNAASGVFLYPIQNSGSGSGALYQNLQALTADVVPASNAGAVYMVEGHYVTADDAAAGNDNNNASYRTVTFNSTAQMTLGISPGQTSGQPTKRQRAAIEGWQDVDPTVVLSYVDVPGDGRFIVAVKAVSIGGGFTRYNYAVHNLSSDRSGESFTVNFPNGTTMQNLSFRDVDYHSGEPYSLTDWTGTIASNGVIWQSTQTYAQNPNANALRWSTCYSFSVEANAAPTGTSIGLFKPVIVTCPTIPANYPVGSYTLNSSAPFDLVPTGSLTNIGNGPTGDDTAVTALLPFAFNFYGRVLTSIQVASNGYLAVPATGATAFTNTSIPNVAPPNGTIFGLWDDLDPSVGGTITYGTAGTAPNRRFVANYNAVRFFGSTNTATFQIILNENGTITSTHVNGSASSATRGVESQNGTTGTLGSLNNASGGVANTTWVYTPSGPMIPPTALMAQVGNGAPNTVVGISLTCPTAPNSPVIVLGDIAPGSTNLGALGTLGLTLFSPTFFVFADGLGALAPINPTAVTDSCGLWSFTLPTGPAGLLGLSLYFQGTVWNGAPGLLPPPNFVFHMSNTLHFDT